MSFPARLRALRKATGLNQSQLSYACGFPRGYVGLFENGRRADPWASTLAVLSETLGCSLDYLILGRGEAPSASVIRAAIERAQANPDAVRQQVERALGVVLRRRTAEGVDDAPPVRSAGKTAKPAPTNGRALRRPPAELATPLRRPARRTSSAIARGPFTRPTAPANPGPATFTAPAKRT